MSETRSKYSLKGARKSDIALAALFIVAFGVLVAVLALNGPFKAETNANQPLVPTAPTADADYVTVNYGPILLLPGIGILIVGIGVIVYALRRKLARIFVGQGMLAWVGVIIIGTIVGSLLDKSIGNLLGAGLRYELYKGISQGLIYALVIYAIAVRGLRGAGWSDGLGFGLGFGLVEQMAVGGLAELILVGGVLVSGVAPLGAIPTLNMIDGLPGALIAIVNSAALILVHVGSATLIFYALTFADRRRWGWLLAAALYEGASYTASRISNGGLSDLGQQLTIAFAIVLWAALGYAITLWLRPRFPHEQLQADDAMGQLVGKPL